VSGYPFAVVLSLGLVVFLVVLLRTRRLREKYAITWIVVGLGVTVFGAFPAMAEWLARAVGVQTPSNLLFAIALIVLLLVGIQLSAEITSLEEETRTLVEEVALLRFDVGRALAGPAAANAGPPVVQNPASGGEAERVEADLE
jgi:hypothetical protein